MITLAPIHLRHGLSLLIEIMNMTKPFIMTLIKNILLFCSALLFVVSCDQDIPAPGEYGYFLYFSKSPADTMVLRTNCYLAEPEVNMDCPDLLITTVAYESLEDFGSKQYYSDANKGIENNISDYLLETTGRKFDGGMPLKVEYRTEVCTDIKIQMFDENNQLVSDVTDLARFHYVHSEFSMKDVVENLLITSEQQDIHKIDLGSTISEYLSFKPLVFANAHFIFPELEKDILGNGNYLKVEIQLDNGIILTSISKCYWQLLDFKSIKYQYH